MELSAQMIRSRDIIFNADAFNNIKLVAISGSIGRKEKSIEDTDLNDVDFFVVAEKCDFVKKKFAEEELNMLLKTEFTDITFIKEKKLLNILLRREISQFLFDTLKGHINIYYDHEFYKKFEKFIKRNYEVEYKSALIVFFTRLWSLIGPFGIKYHDFYIRNDKIATYQIKKAISAIIDSILIHEKFYKFPNKDIKINDFKKTSFYKENYVLVDKVISIYTDVNKIDIIDKEIYKNVLELYLKCRDQLFENKSLIQLICIMDKKYFIKRILFKSKAKIILQYIERYKTLLTINEFLNENLGDEEVNKLSSTMEKIYKEAFGGGSNV